jgi:hypothetical protein
MPDVTEFMLRHRDHPPAKKGTVAGIRDLSDVEQMIRRYLELAASALKEPRGERQEEVSA